eukprot:GGOE01027584.1.p1 GENE.GGOE01027584.1~~GGOE01027584.1.p1  ORF type:complete len:260 (+),score=33.71 GGOE01027584.1:55-834(+)
MDVARQWLQQQGLSVRKDHVKLACVILLPAMMVLVLLLASRSAGQKPGTMDCQGAVVCGVLTLESGLGSGVYGKWPPSIHGLWPQVPPFGNSDCRPPTVSAAEPNAPVACFHESGFQAHEWRKHGTCAGVPDATNFFRQVCSLAAHPLEVMERAGHNFDAQLRSLEAAGIAIFRVDRRNYQFQLSACAGCDGTWILTPQSTFGQQCSGSCPLPRSPTTAQDVCSPGRKGPPCSSDADCARAHNCLRCARSGFCTDVPLH